MNQKDNNDKSWNILYWFLPFLIALIQLMYSANSTFQIRYEELGEGVRNVFWLHQGYLYDGGSSNVGWYGLLLLIYNFFGFDLFTAKLLRVILLLASLICLAGLLKNLLGVKKAFIPLIAIATSPALLFFNTLNVEYGIDLVYLPIVLLLIQALKFRNSFFDYIKTISLGVITMIAWLSYPTFIFYFPILIFFFIWRLRQNTQQKLIKFLPQFISGLIAFCLPFLTTIIYLKEPTTFLADPKDGKGVFRAGGVITGEINLFLSSVGGVFLDLFYKGQSYYYEVVYSDFSGVITILPLLASILISSHLIKEIKWKWFILVIYLTVFANLVLAGFSTDGSDNPGLRRFTPTLAAIYALFTISWYFVTTHKWQEKAPKILISAILLILPLQHLLVLPLNISQIQTSPYQYSLWFGNNPDKSVQQTVETLKKEDLKLACFDQEKQPIQCRYQEFYTTVKGACIWNRLQCKEILGYDEKRKEYIPLNTNLWRSYYWDH